MARRLMTTAGPLLPRLSTGDVPEDDDLKTTKLEPSPGTQCVRGFVNTRSPNITCKFSQERGIVHDHLHIWWTLPQKRADLMFGFRILDERVSLRAYEFRTFENVVVYRIENPVVVSHRVIFDNPLPLGWLLERERLTLWLDLEVVGEEDVRDVRRTFNIDFDVGFVSQFLRDKLDGFRGDVRFPFPFISVMALQNDVDLIADAVLQRILNAMAPHSDEPIEKDEPVERLAARMARAIDPNRARAAPVNTARCYCQYFYHLGPFPNPKKGESIVDANGSTTGEIEPDELPGQWRVSYPKSGEVPDVTDEEIDEAYKIAVSSEGAMRAADATYTKRLEEARVKLKSKDEIPEPEGTIHLNLERDPTDAEHFRVAEINTSDAK